LYKYISDSVSNPRGDPKEKKDEAADEDGGEATDSEDDDSDISSCSEPE